MTAVAKPQRILAFDFGLKRTGVAAGNSLTMGAQPLRTIAAEGDARWAQIASLIQEWQPDALVVGVPFHPDGTAHEMTARCKKFARQLEGRYGVKVHEVDERYTSAEAQSNDPAGARDLDGAAAQLIAEQFLRSLA